MNRREFLFSSSLAVLGLTCTSCRSGSASANPKSNRQRIAFNTANLVGRVSGYRYELRNWGEQHRKTIAATDERAWDSICGDIAAAGYRAVEIWEAHAAPESLNANKAKTWRRILEDHGLRPVAYAGGLRPETIQVCQWLGIPHVDGSLRGQTPEEATALCRASGIAFNLENHPEKTVEEILKPIGGGNQWLGVCVDTGWLGTQGASSPAIIKALDGLVRHTHIKDVQRAGTHETCRLGDGVVNIPAALEALREINYQGWYSWEDEPEDRNPFDLARWTLNYLQSRV
ncbi:MAG TPA: sugar phosphate isomerase/epimerase family protein [Clostridia bacterium]|nr:sugar phosphate isomerase/epimerase family protein [Clostridia bacterium]